MKSWIAGGIGIVAAVLVFSLLRPLSAPADLVVDVFSVAVLVFGTLRGEVPGAVFGAVCGLIVDAFSLGVFGIAGLSLTPGGFLAGYVSRKINIQPFFRTFVFFIVLAVGMFAGWAGLTVLVGRSPLPWSGGLVVLRPVVSAVVASAIYEGIRRIKARHER